MFCRLDSLMALLAMYEIKKRRRTSFFRVFQFRREAFRLESRAAQTGSVRALAIRLSDKRQDAKKITTS